MKNRKPRKVVVVIMTVLVVTGVIIFCMWQNGGVVQNEQTEKPEEEKEAAKDETYMSLSTSDRQTADIYAELYETSREEVAELYVQANDWEKTGEELEKDFFAISENKKYQMTEDGYSLKDIEEAEKLSARTGIKAMELIQAKGKAADNRSWSEVKEEKGIKE